LTWSRVLVGAALFKINAGTFLLLNFVPIFDDLKHR
jgi:hypothetical protein